MATLLFNGCSDDTSSKSMVSTQKSAKIVKEDKASKQEIAKKPIYEKIDLSDTFKDSAKISNDNKYLIMIFDRDNCKYCYQLKKDISINTELKDKLKNEFATYSLDAGNNKLHKIMHEGKFIDVDTKTMIDIYGVTSTPTIIFSDKSSKSIFVVPGYMPAKQFLVTLEFIEKGLWLNKDRKNGEVYKELKKFYILKGIIKETSSK